MPPERSTHRVERTIPSELKAGHQLIEHLLDRLRDQQWDGRDFFAIRLALEEGVVNAIKHGNRLDASKQVHVRCRISKNKMWIQITDEGRGFDPHAVADCTDAEHIELPSGRGIMLMRNFMNRVEYNKRGNVVTMEKVRTGGN